MLFSLSALALAHPHPEPNEYDQEIVVWGDPFLQWEQRWLVQSEFRFPVVQWLAGDHRQLVPTLSMRVRAVLDCAKDAPRGKRRWDVTCTIDDVAFQALVLDPPAGPAPDGSATSVLEEWDALFTGQEVRLRVRDDRAILGTDLPPMPQLDRQSRRRQEMLRQIAVRLVAPLQVELPSWVSTGSTWFEPHSRLLQMPTSTAPFGAAETVHRLDELDGHWVVQSKGRASMMPGLRFGWGSSDVFRLEMAGVARFDQQSGLMVERVWHVGGLPTASAEGQLAYHTYGQMLLLDANERPHLGRSRALPARDWVFDPTFAPGGQVM